MGSRGTQRVRLLASEPRRVARLRAERVRVVHDSPWPDYEGETTVVPAVEAQTLPTADTVLHRDVTVKEIPYYTTTNLSGGYTATIGG